MKKNDTFLVYGLVTGIVTALVQVAIMLSSLRLNPFMGYVADIPFLAGIIMNAVAYSKANDGYVSFGNVFGSCFKATLIVTILTIIAVIFISATHPELKEQAIVAAREKLQRDGRPDDQIEMGVNIATKGYTLILVGGTLIGSLILGSIFSLIGAGVAKKKGPQVFVPDNIQ